ncbi:MAG: phosphate ABC transporter permease subunit PstC [Puniceicoccales bacterium]|jgi:phosphate transport system permease protein|nr:phosphate ABC transporter permease subunit PstC [Puniceicoccales bacterium]
MPPDDARGSATGTNPTLVIGRARRRFLGLTLDNVIQGFFGGNALAAIIVLGLIVIFLFREGGEFFGQNQHNLEVYRKAGLEYVDYMRRQEGGHAVLNRQLLEIRREAFASFISGKAGQGTLSPEAANARLAEFDHFSEKFSDAVMPLRTHVSELGELAVETKTRFAVSEDRKTQRAQLLAVGKGGEAAKVLIEEVDYRAALAPILAMWGDYQRINRELARQLETLVVEMPLAPIPSLVSQMAEFKRGVQGYVATFPDVERELQAWNHSAPIGWHESFTSFIFGYEWLTASFWQDWYGILPLLAGSVLVSLIALFISVPFAIAAAVYVNQIARRSEQRLIKPAIEFISAIPSVVLGFFGIVVLGHYVRSLSQEPWLSWVPGFPVIERLNALTAGCLLALISIPAIFTLAEDALNNVPSALREASFALGASRIQTMLRVIMPAAVSGIISAILLGFGRVIGETMVVLLCAGNRIAIPDFMSGPSVVTQPVHTMTGIIAQEMGEVSPGSIHYRALFIVGVVLFFLSLFINYVAQRIVLKYRRAL